MTKLLWWIVAAIVLAILAVWYSGRDVVTYDQPSGATGQSSSQSPAASETPTDQTTSSGQYLTYRGDLTIGTGRRLLFFHAPWCPQCRALEASIQAEGVPEGVTIIKVDYDSNQALRQRYGVTIQTTLVEIDATGELVDRYVAYEEPSIGAVSSHFTLE